MKGDMGIQSKNNTKRRSGLANPKFAKKLALAVADANKSTFKTPISKCKSNTRTKVTANAETRSTQRRPSDDLPFVMQRSLLEKAIRSKHKRESKPDDPSESTIGGVLDYMRG